MTQLRRSRLPALAVRTALGTSLVALAAPLAAQVSPDTVPLAPSSNRPQTRFETFANGAGGQTLTVDLRNRPSTIINWRGFDIGADSTARFVSTNGEIANLTDAFSVLNRVTSGNPTTILGRLTSQPNIAVFLLNGSGIVFGSGSVVSTGSFIASTLDIGDRNFTRGKFRFGLGEGLSGPITVAAGAALRSTGGDGMRRGVVLVAPTIESAGRVEGGGGDVAFVSAADVTLNLRPGSPLGISISRGLPVQASQVVGGRVEGQNVYLALATEAEVTASLLQVDGKVRAVGTGNGVVIVAGEARGDAPGVVFRRGSDAASTRGVIDIATNAGSVLRSGGNIAVEGRGGADMAGLVSARGDVSAFLLGSAQFGGALVADGDVRIAAASVDVASARSGGALTARATGGALSLGIGEAGAGADLRAAGDLTIGTRLRTGEAVRLAAGEDVRIAKVQTADGGIFVSARNGEVTGTTADRGAILVAGRRDDGTGDALGIRAGSLVRIGRGRASGDIGIVSAAGAIAANRLAGDAVSLVAGEGDITLGRAAADGRMRLAAGQDIDVRNAVRAEGTLALLSGGAITAGAAVSTAANVRARADAIDLGSVRAAGLINLDASAGDVALGGGSAGVARLAAAGDVAIAGALTAEGQVTIRSGGELRATGLRSLEDDVRVAAAAIDVGRAQAAEVLRLQAGAGDVAIDRGIAGTTAFVAASGTVRADGILAAGTRLTVKAGAAAALAGVRAGGGVFLDAAGGDLSLRAASAGGRAALSATGDIRATGVITAFDTLSIVAGGAVTTGDAVAEEGDLRVAGQSLDLGDARAGERLGLTATAGGIALRSGRAGTAARLNASGDVDIARRVGAGGGLRIGADGAVTARAVDAGGLLNVSGSAVRIGRADAGGRLALRATGGGIALGNGSAGREATLTATGDVRVGRALDAGRDLAIDAGGAARLGALTSTRGGIGVSGTAVSIASADARLALDVAATGGLLRMGDVAAGTDATFSAARAMRASGGIAVGRTIAIDADGAANLAEVVARRGDLAIRADRLTMTRARAGGTLTLEATGGDMALGTAVARESAAITATGAVRATGLLAARENLRLTAGRGVSVQTVRAGTGDLDIAGKQVTAAALIAGDALALDAARGNAILGRAVSGGSADIEARGAVVATGGVTAGAGLSVRAGGQVTMARAVAGTGALDVNGRAVEIRRAAAGDDVAIRARAGDLRLGSAVAGGGMSLVADGTVDVAGRVSADGAVTVRADESATFGGLRAGPGADLRVRADAITARDAGAGGAIDLRARNGAVSLGRAAAGERLDVNATGDVTFSRRASGSHVAIEAGGRADLGRVVGSAGRVTVAADSIAARSIAAAARLHLDAGGGSVRAGTLTADGAVAIAAAQDVRVRDALTSGRRAGVTAGGVARLGAADAGGNLAVTAARVQIDTANAAGRLDVQATRGALVLGEGSTGAEATLVATGNLTLARTLESGGETSLIAGADMRLGAVTSGGDMTVEAARGAVRGIDAAGASLTTRGSGAIRVDAADAIDLAMLDAAGRARVRGGMVAAGTVRTGGPLAIATSQGRLAIGEAIAGSAATLTSAADLVVRDGLVAGGDATLLAAGDMRLRSVRTENGAITLDAAGEVTGYPAGRGALLSANGGADGLGHGITISGGGPVRVAAARADGGVSIRSGQAIAAGLIRAGDGGIRLDAASNAIGTREGGMRLIAGGTRGIVVDAGGAIRVRSGRSAGDMRLTGSGIDAGALRAADMLSLEARDADLVLRDARAGAGALLDAAGDVRVAERLVGRDVLVRTGGDAGLARVEALGGALRIRALQGAVTGADPDTGAVLRAGGAQGDVVVIAGGPVDLGGVRAGRHVRVRTPGTAELGRVEASGNLDLDSGTIAAGALVAGGRVDAVARAGRIEAAGVIARGGDVDLRSAGGLSLGTVRAAGAMMLDAGGEVTVTGLARALGGDLGISGAGVDVGTAAALGDLTLTANNGRIALGRGSAGADAILTATGDVDVTRQLAGEGDVSVRAGGDATLAIVTARAGDLLVDARQGMVTAAALTGRTVAAYAGTGATLTTATATQGDVTVVTGATAAGTDAASGGGVADLGIVTAAGAVTVRAGSIVAGSVEATTDALVLTGVGGAAGDRVTLDTGRAGGDATIIGAGAIAITDALRSDGAVRIATGAERLASLGVVTAGTTLAIDAGDLALAGALTAASASIRSNAAAGMLLGDGTPVGGMHLDNAEVGLIRTPVLLFDAGGGAVRMGTLSLGDATGQSRTTIATTGMVEVTGAVSAAADDRTVTIGGAAGVEASRASSISIVATAGEGAISGGGRLSLDGNTLHLRGERIAAGQSDGFLDVLGGLADARAVADQFVNNARSALYAARQPYPDAPVLVSAQSMTVDYGTYALFQNTGRLTTAAGVNGSRTGVVLGAPGSGPSLTLRSDGAGSGNTFALFGTIAGVANEAAAVVGQTILSTRIDGTTETIVIQDSRVNGCIIGTGAGCLTTPIGIPPVNIFDPSRLNVFVPADFEIAFDPVIGSNNEALFAGIAAIDVPSESELPFDPAIGSNNEALFTGAADDAAAGEDGCREDPTGRTCPRKESRK